LNRAVRWLLAGWLVVAAGAAGHANWTASGSVSYRDREFDQTGFTGVEPLLPARFVDIEVVDAGSSAVIGSGATNALGAFSFTVTDSQTRNVYLRALTRSTTTPTLFIKVTNVGASPYAIATSTINGHTSATNVDFGALVAAIGAGGEAFNLYDQAVYGSDYLAFLQGARPTSSHALKIVWQIDGGIGGSFTNSPQSGSTTINMRDTSGYDDAVVCHEYGHFADFNYSATSSPGGAHALADCHQDTPRTSAPRCEATSVSPIRTSTFAPMAAPVPATSNCGSTSKRSRSTHAAVTRARSPCSPPCGTSRTARPRMISPRVKTTPRSISWPSRTRSTGKS
jgi:hypothetical protein